jgi:hypothetical protein
MIGESARIAELPQIAIPTVIRADKGGRSPRRRASHAPSASALVTVTTIATTLEPPVASSWPRVSRAPSSVMPIRSA